MCYGLYYSENFRWIVEWFSPVRRKGRGRAIWLSGLLLCFLETIRYLPYIGDGSMSTDAFLSILHSFLVVQVFVEPIVSQVHVWIIAFRGAIQDRKNDKPTDKENKVRRVQKSSK